MYFDLMGHLTLSVRKETHIINCLSAMQVARAVIKAPSASARSRQWSPPPAPPSSRAAKAAVHAIKSVYMHTVTSFTRATINVQVRRS